MKEHRTSSQKNSPLAKWLLCLASMVFMLALSVPAFAQTAKSLPLNGTWDTQTITADETPVFWSVTLPSDGLLEITVQSFRDYTRFEVRDPDLTLTFDSCPVHSGSSVSPGTNSMSGYYTKGTYYISAIDNLVGWHGGGDVRIKASFTSVNAADKEPNSSFSQAMNLPAGQKVRGALTKLTDRFDFYKIQVPSSGTVTFQFNSMIEALTFQLYDKDQQLLTKQRPILLDGTPESPKGGSWSTELSPGTYYVQVTDNIFNSEPEGYYDFTWNCFVPVSSVSLNKSSLSMTAGDTAALTASVSPSNATDKSLAWTSSDSSVVSVNSSGRLTAKKAGKATITVTAKDGTNLSKKCAVTVKAKVTAPKRVGKLTSSKSTWTRNSVTLKWSSVSGASGYRVYKYDRKTKTYKKYKDTTKTSLKVTGLSAETKYTFKVAAYKKAGGVTKFGTQSPARSVWTAPRQLSSSRITSKKTLKKTSSKWTVQLKWKKVSGASGYRVYYRQSGGSWRLLKKTRSTTLKVSLKKGKSYSIRVAAYRTKNGLTTLGKYSKAVSYKTK